MTEIVEKIGLTMRIESQIEAAAGAAAEKANGGKFSDPLFYKAEHQTFWREVIRAAFGAAERASPKPNASGEKTPSKGTEIVSLEELAEFSGHCVFLRSVYTFAMRIWRDSNDGERKLMESIAPLFFEDMGKVLTEFLVTAACRITDPAVDSRGNKNFTVELFVKSFEGEPETHKQLDQLHQRMNLLRSKILPARNKLGAHADREIIQKGEPVGAATWKDCDDFWSALQDFVRTLNMKISGKPFEIEAGGVLGDAESLIKALRQSQFFETLLNGKDSALKRACLAVALPD